LTACLMRTLSRGVRGDSRERSILSALTSALMHSNPNLWRIRALNDNVRRSVNGATVHFTRGIAALTSVEQAFILDRGDSFNDFTDGDDPWGEHDFGSFEHFGTTIFWKIDCYDRDMRSGSPDAADPAVTRRVVTIMLAEEY
jgi:hypothetical protein